MAATASHMPAGHTVTKLPATTIPKLARNSANGQVSRVATVIVAGGIAREACHGAAAAATMAADHRETLSEVGAPPPSETQSRSANARATMATPQAIQSRPGCQRAIVNIGHDHGHQRDVDDRKGQLRDVVDAAGHEQGQDHAEPDRRDRQDPGDRVDPQARGQAGAAVAQFERQEQQHARVEGQEEEEIRGAGAVPEDERPQDVADRPGADAAGGQQPVAAADAPGAHEHAEKRDGRDQRGGDVVPDGVPRGAGPGAEGVQELAGEEHAGDGEQRAQPWGSRAHAPSSTARGLC